MECLFLLINSVQNIVVDNKSQLTDTQITYNIKNYEKCWKMLIKR